MYPGIEQVFLQHGYRQISLNIKGVALCVKSQGETGYAVITIDEIAGAELSREQFVHIKEQMLGFMKRSFPFYVSPLFLLISENEQSAGRLFDERDFFWRIVPSENRLMVFQASAHEYEELRQPLERLYPGGWQISSGGEFRQGANTGKRTEVFGAGRRFPVGNGEFPVVNLGIVGLNILCFLITDFILLGAEQIVDLYALNWQRVVEYGEWYRLVTSMFLHGGVQHIAGNMFVLLYIGSCLEQQIGKVRYMILYLGSGIVAGLASMVYNMRLETNVYSLGASGAIFGVMGALLFLVIFCRKYAGGFNIRQILTMVILTLFSGFNNPSVDNMAHIGGCIAGFLLTALLMIGFRQTREKI